MQRSSATRTATSAHKRWRQVVGRQSSFEFVVNRERLTLAEIDEFKRITGLKVLEPGRYWLDLATGNMGFEGEAYPRANVFAQRV